MCRLDLYGFSFDGIADTSTRKHFRLFAQTLCFGGKARFQGLGLFETATLRHALLLQQEEAGAQRAFSSPIDTQSRAMTG
jgi:hypothetical protein